MTRLLIVAGVAAAVLLIGCGSDSDTDSETSAEEAAPAEESGTPEETQTPEQDGAPGDSETPTETATPEETVTPEITGPSPGVTDGAIKVGIAYVDTDALQAIGLNYDLGEHEAVYEALIADINDDGGINGRQLDAVIEPVDPTSPVPAEELCVKFTVDEGVFLVTGFWLRETVLCPLDLYETAAVGGGMTPDRVEQAKAPWVTWESDTEANQEILRTFAEMGALDGTVGVFADDSEEESLDSQLLPTLEELGVDVLEVAIGVAPPEDQTAVQNEVLLIAERFESAGVDTVLLVGPDDVWPRYMTGEPYDPQLLFTDRIAGSAFATNEDTTDTSILDGALFGGEYGPNQAIFDEATMQECVAIIEAAGIETLPPSDFSDDDPSNQPYQAAFQACRDVYLMRALLEAAGENLNYGTLELAIDGLEVAIPGDPIPRTYGPPMSADGDPAAYIFTWNEEVKDFELIGS